MKYILSAPDGVVLRDGKPFGEAGTTGSGFHDWPLPQTLAGMVRSSVALRRDPDFFQQPGRAEDLFRIGLKSILTVAYPDTENPEPLFPVPADLLFTPAADGGLNIHTAKLTAFTEGEGAILPFAEALLPTWATAEKPAHTTPRWLKESFFLQYVAESIESPRAMPDIGCAGPVSKDVMHNALENGVTKEHSLFQTRTVYFSVSTANPGIPLGIALEVDGLELDDALPLSAYLGGERRRVELREFPFSWPACPDFSEPQRFLKLILATHGAFGGWIPSWLDAAGEHWACVPETIFSVRLRCAVLPRWKAVSGWDYAARRPKATRKLVPPGSVYVIELQNPAQAGDLARHLWGESICEGPSARDGYGLCYVAKAARMAAAIESINP